MQSLQESLAGTGPITEVRFDGEDMEEAHLAEAEFRGCRFTQCNFDDATFRACRFYACVFDHCSFRESIIEDCHFCEGETGTQWRYCNLSQAEFRRCNLSLNTMVGSKAYLTAFSDCAAAGIQLDLETQRKVRTQILAGGVSFRKCRLQYAAFSAADFRESVFEGCDLRDANLSGCNLTQASFRGSSLHNIDFSGSTLDHADLSHASFDALDLSDMASFHAAVVTRDQHEAILASLGILTAD